MKAYHIMMFLFIFNMFFWVLTAGLVIYDVEYGTDDGFNLLDKTSQDSWTADDYLGLISVFTLFHSFELSIIAIAVAIAGGAMLGIFTAGQGSQGIVYGLFGYFFWSGISNTFSVFINLTNGHPGAIYVLAIFGMIIAMIFVVGLFQMVTGGWKSHE